MVPCGDSTTERVHTPESRHIGMSTRSAAQMPRGARLWLESDPLRNSQLETHPDDEPGRGPKGLAP
jgi:hypothetical protein